MDVSAGFYIAIATQRGGLWVVGGHQGGDGSSHLAPYGHWVGFVCMGGAPRLVDPDTPRAPHFASWGHPHTHKTNPVAIVGYNRAHTTPPGAPISPHTATLCPLVFSYMISTEYLGFFVLHKNRVFVCFKRKN